MDDVELRNEDTIATTSKNSCNREPLSDWNKDDKFQLYLGIRIHGSKKVNKIHNDLLPNKSMEEIEAAIAYYLEKAKRNQHCTVRVRKVKKVKAKPLIPLASWAKVLTDSMSYKELQTEIATAIRLIADLEHMPDPLLTEQIDFRKVYHHLADTVEGKSLSIYDRLESDVLSDSVFNTALVSKTFFKQFRNVIASINLTDRELSGFPKPTNDPQLAIIRDLVSQRNYNPLNINEYALRYLVNEFSEIE